LIQEHIDSGNNGHLFRAFDASTNSALACKIVPVDNLPHNSDDQDAYLNEAKQANLLDHSSVVRCVNVVPYAGPCSGSKINFRVTDFGVRKLTGYAAHARDYLYTAEALRQLLPTPNSFMACPLRQKASGGQRQ
jgi:hypothetical protein